jgi:hypothetical protein
MTVAMGRPDTEIDGALQLRSDFVFHLLSDPAPPPQLPRLGDRGQELAVLTDQVRYELRRRNGPPFGQVEMEADAQRRNGPHPLAGVSRRRHIRHQRRAGDDSLLVAPNNRVAQAPADAQVVRVEDETFSLHVRCGAA